MTQNRTLKALRRDETGKESAKRLRTSGRIPAVVYGKESESFGISVDQVEAEHLFYNISVENTIVQLEVDGEDEPIPALIREIQSYPHKSGVIHVDFYRIQKGVALELNIPVHLEGVPVGVKESGGVLEQIINELRVKCIPSKIPESIDIEVADLEVGDAIHVYDLELGEGVEILVDPQRTVCTVAIPKVLVTEEEEEEEELEELLEEGVEAEGVEEVEEEGAEEAAEEEE
jgi:large subunit ribosomal protein L25